MLRTVIYFHVYIILDFPITYRYASVFCQSECACLYKTVNMVVLYVKNNENTYPHMQMYRIILIPKRGNLIVANVDLAHALSIPAPSYSLFYYRL